MAFAPIVSLGIASRIGPHFVRHAINLDCQAGLVTEEIEHIGAKRMLAAELEAAGAIAKVPPEQAFGKRERTPERAGGLY